MNFSKVRRQILMGVMAVALTAGLSVRIFAADSLLQQIKQHNALNVGLKGTYSPFRFQR